MTRWTLLFLVALLCVLVPRYATYSPLPEDVFIDCAVESSETKLLGLWELDRINNYEALQEGLTASDSAILNFLTVRAYPFLLERSQLYRIEQCGNQFALTVNFFRAWLVTSAEVEESSIKVALKDFQEELKESFAEVLTDVKDALSIEEKPVIDKQLKFLVKPNDLEVSAELTFANNELKIYGSLNGKNYKERIYYDAGELIRELSFTGSQLGSTDFIYRRYP